MATEWFLRLDPIKGDSTDDRHRGEHVVLSWAWGVQAAASAGGGPGGGVGRADFDDLGLVVPPGRAAGEIVNACAQGQRLPKAVLSGRRSGLSRAADFLTITLSDVFVTSTRLTAVSGGDEPAQALTLGYGKVEVVTRVQDPKGGVGEEVRTGWDVHGNRAG